MLDFTPPGGGGKVLAFLAPIERTPLGAARAPRAAPQRPRRARRDGPPQWGARLACGGLAGSLQQTKTNPTHMTTFAIGMRVRLVNLTTADLNGAAGVLEHYDPEVGRWHVAVRGNKPPVLRIREANLERADGRRDRKIAKDDVVLHKVEPGDALTNKAVKVARKWGYEHHGGVAEWNAGLRVLGHFTGGCRFSLGVVATEGKDGPVVGLGCFFLSKGKHPVGEVLNEVEIVHVLVDPKARRCGVGAAICAEAQELAVGMECDRLVAEVMPAAFDFWRALGYEVAPDLSTGDVYDALHDLFTIGDVKAQTYTWMTKKVGA
jgi:GNAT superfamily N-acetyltransferase